MVNNLDEIVAELKTDGIVVVNDVYSSEQCDEFRDILDRAVAKRRSIQSYCGDDTNQVLDNYFTDDPSLLELLYQPITDKVMRRMIDDDYVLISPSARNRRLVVDGKFGKKTSGHGWHTDSRFTQGGRGFEPSLCYMAVVLIDDFACDNGATHFIRGSHKLYQRPEDRDADLDYENMVGKAGSVVIFDTALWHRVGEASRKSRWGVFNTYGPWFMKPYHRFWEMFSEQEFSEMSPIIKQMLHCDSLPPRDHDESMITLRRVRERVECV